MNWLNYVMVRQKNRDASSEFSTTKVTHTWNSYRPAVLPWVISLTSKSEDREQAHSLVGDHRDAVENAVPCWCWYLIPTPLELQRAQHCLHKMFFESWEESLTSKYTSLSFEGSEQYLISDFHHAHKNDLCPLRTAGRFHSFLYTFLVCVLPHAKKPSPR